MSETFGKPEVLSQERGEDSKQKLMVDVANFLKELEEGNFEGKFGWEGHDDESGEKEFDRYQDSAENKKLWELIGRAVKLGLVTEGEGYNLMIATAAKELKEKLG